VTRRYFTSTAITTSLTAELSASATSMTVDAATFTGYPTSYPYTLVLDEGLSTEEVVEISSAAGTTLTIGTRGVDSTTAQVHANGASVKLGVSARDFNEANAHVYLDGQTATKHSSVHGLAGQVVGTSDTQTLTNKTITGGTVNSTSLQRGSQNAVTNTATMTTNGALYANGTNTAISTAAGTTGQVLKAVTSSAPVFGAVSLTADVGSSILPIANGGLNQSSALTSNGVLVGGTSVTATAAGTTGQVLKGNTSSAPTFGSVSLTADVGSSILPVANGGNGIDTSAAWLSFTPTYTNVTSGAGTFSYRKVGTTLFYRGTFTGGTVTAAGTVSITLPASVTLAGASSIRQPFSAHNGAAVTYARGLGGGTTITFWADTAGTQFALSASLTNLSFSGVFETT